MPRRRWRRLLFHLLLPFPVGAVVMAIQPLWLIDLLARTEPRIVWQVDTPEPLAALTFDDGPDPVSTPKILDRLASDHAKATFFLIGENAHRHPQLVERIRAEGHEIGNHTNGSEPTMQQSLAAFEQSVTAAESALGEKSGTPRFFRPASGFIRPEQLAWLASHEYQCVLGSAYPYDPLQPPARYMVWLVGKNLRPGTIVVLHDGGSRPHTLDALGGILDAGRAKGLRFVTLSDLWAARKK
jgi:peptidoglycan/xylan/chitin deacetylase (PgdA/CDA1 family)